MPREQEQSLEYVSDARNHTSSQEAQEGASNRSRGVSDGDFNKPRVSERTELTLGLSRLDRGIPPCYYSY